jgi:DNA-binding MarR family transcriptional regulator
MSRISTGPVAVPAAGAPSTDRGEHVVIELAALGHDITNAIEDYTGRTDLVGNVPSLILCQLLLQGPRRPRDLMETTHLSSGGLTKQLDHLEAEGLITREFGTLRDDRRASVVSLTPDGRRAAQRIGEAVESRFARVREAMDRVRELLGE